MAEEKKVEEKIVDATAEYATLKADYEKLKAEHDGIKPKVEKWEAAEQDRASKAAKAEEEKRKKELGADKLLEEKVAELKTTTERLDAFEKRERERADSLYSDLPEELQEGIASFKDKLDLSDWVALVEKQQTLADKMAEKAKAGGVIIPPFTRPGGAQAKGEYEPSAKAREILDELGKGMDMIKKLTVAKSVDEETRQVGIRFSRQIHSFFKDMNLSPVKRLMTPGK